MGSELRYQDFDLAKFQAIIRRNSCSGAFFRETWPQISKEVLSRRPSSGTSFGQIPSRVWA